MHDTAYEIGRRFFQIYATVSSTIVEIGSCNVNGTLRDFCPKGATYVGLDLAPGRCVDVVIAPDAPLPVASSSADVVISSSTFEHDTFFWDTFLEMVRITKPGGLLYINAPSNGKYHRYPVDNWRFYPDCGHAFVRWAAKNGYELVLLESFLAERRGDVWNDFAAIFKKGPLLPDSKTTLVSDGVACTNIWSFGEAKVRLERKSSEDMAIISALRDKVTQLARALEAKSGEVSALQNDAVAQRLACERLSREMADQANKAERLRKAIDTIEASIFWRLSRPFRRLLGYKSSGQ